MHDPRLSPLHLRVTGRPSLRPRPPSSMARIIHDGLSRIREIASRDERACSPIGLS